MVKKNKGNNIHSTNETNGKRFPWVKFLLKVTTLLAIVTSVVLFTDKKEYFVGDQKNNHSGRKWHAFYDFAEKKHKNVDILILGNSHASAGIDPYILSENTGAYAYILNTPGTGSIDTYYNLKEVLKYCKPQLVVVETYCLFDDGVGKEWACIQSIESKKGVWNQLSLLPHYLDSDNWLKAMSTTIRNHSYLLTDTARVAYNYRNVGKDKNPQKNNLELGRFSHGTNGMSDSVYQKFLAEPGPFRCEDAQITDETHTNIRKLKDLCDQHSISLMFITIPMFLMVFEDYEHTRGVYKKFIDSIPGARWLDLQHNYDTTCYTRDAFNDEYGSWQHTTYIGMRHSTYQLSRFIQENYADKIADRRNDTKWFNDFKDNDNYIYNQPYREGVKDVKCIVQDTTIYDLNILEMSIKEEKNANAVILKLDTAQQTPDSLHLYITLQGYPYPVPIESARSQHHNPSQHKVYLSYIKKEVTVERLVAVSDTQGRLFSYKPGKKSK